MKVTTEVKVRVTDLDFLGHVNNAVYMQYLECGREEWYREAGITYNQQAERGISTVVVHAGINYRKEARQGERLSIKTKPLRRGKKSFSFYQEILNEHGEIVIDATVTEVCFDLRNRISVTILGEIAVHFEGLEE